MKYFFTLIVIFTGIHFSNAQTSYVFNPTFQNIDTTTCLSDTNVMLLRPEGWKIYQTTNDEWNGPVDSNICIQAEFNTWNFDVDLNTIDTARHLFIVSDSAFNHTLLPKNAVYDLMLETYLNGNGYINMYGNCGMTPCSFIAANIEIPDSNGTGITHRFEPASLDTIIPMECTSYSVCIASEKFDSQYVANLVIALKFSDVDSTSELVLYNFDLRDITCDGLFIPDMTDTFTSITAYQSGLNYYYFINSEAYLGLYHDTTYPAPNHISYLYVYPEDNQQTTPQTIQINVQAFSTLILQPFAQLRGAPVNTQTDVFHNLIINLDGGSVCLPFIDVIIHRYDKFIYNEGKIEFHAPMSCLLFLNGSTFEIADSATLYYGPPNHEGVLALYEDAKIEIGHHASLNIYNTVHIREQNPLNGPKQFYMTLNHGSTLRFMPGSHLTNVYSADGTMKLNVYMKGGTLDDSGLSPEEKLLINRIYDTSTPSRFEIYPNPASEILHVSLYNSPFRTVSISDLSGRVLYQAVVTNSDFDLDVKDFANGMYFIRASSDNNSAVQTWVKQ